MQCTLCYTACTLHFGLGEDPSIKLQNLSNFLRSSVQQLGTNAFAHRPPCYITTLILTTLNLSFNFEILYTCTDRRHFLFSLLLHVCEQGCKQEFCGKPDFCGISVFGVQSLVVNRIVQFTGWLTVNVFIEPKAEVIFCLSYHLWVEKPVFFLSRRFALYKIESCFLQPLKTPTWFGTMKKICLKGMQNVWWNNEAKAEYICNSLYFLLLCEKRHRGWSRYMRLLPHVNFSFSLCFI